MDDLKKIDYMQLFSFWRTLAICLIAVIAVITLTYILPTVLSPVISLFCAGGLYNIVVKSRAQSGRCALVPYTIFISLILYSFVSIILNVLSAWNLISLPIELIFYKGEYVPSLILLPISFLVVFYCLVRRNHLLICRDCRSTTGDTESLSHVYFIFKSEAHVQLRNLALLFFILSVLVWAYYLIFYVDIAVSNRDWYVFLWLIVLVILIDEIYFVVRYYNLFMDLKENDEIITPSEIEDLTAKTYLRFYVICANYIYVCMHKNNESKYGEVLETPFFTHRNVNGIAVGEVQSIIKDMTGQSGELRFFYGRRTGVKTNTLLRYFYFIDKVDGECPILKTPGEWMDYDSLLAIYNTDSARLARISVVDTTRLATIIVTHKIYDEYGYRRVPLKSYHPSFNLVDVRNSDLDFQDDTWIHISMFNSDTPFFRLKRFWRRLLGHELY